MVNPSMVNKEMVERMLNDVFTGKGLSLPGRPTELRIQQNTARGVTMVSGNLRANTKVVEGGVSARVFSEGVHGFASAAETDAASIKKVLKAAADNAVFLGGRAGNDLGELAPIPGGDESLRIKGKEIPQKDLCDFVLELDAHIAGTCGNLAGRYIGLQCLDMEKMLFASNGGESPVMRSHTMAPRTIAFVGLTVMDKDGAPVELMDVWGGLGFFDDHFNDIQKLHAKIADLYERVVKKSEGVHANAGVRQCVMGPDLAGILAHEAVGHTVEADLILGGSVAAHYMNKPVASELVNMVDFAHTAFGKTAPVPVYVDDEGLVAKDAVLIENGVLKNFMHNRITAKKLGYEPHGNARAFSFSDEPLIRMRNTAILPGTSKLSDLIASVEDGYYLIQSGNGQADSTSEFMFGINEGYEIKNGKVGRAIRDTTISGVAFDMLKTIDMISDDMFWSSGGMCGKKQPIPTGMGGPAVRCLVNIGGR